MSFYFIGLLEVFGLWVVIVLMIFLIWVVFDIFMGYKGEENIGGSFIFFIMIFTVVMSLKGFKFRKRGLVFLFVVFIRSV